ncbi:hypothetical protein Dimus_018560 [Dionaea muscipula]
MGRRKKKPPLIPFSQWTPIVQGLNSDASDEPSDLETSFPLEPLEEENELISEDERCPSSNGADVDLENPPTLEGEAEDSQPLIDEADTSEVAVDADFDDELDESKPNLGIPRISDDLGLHISNLHLHSDTGGPQVNLNSLNTPSMTMNSSVSLISSSQATTLDSTTINAVVDNMPCHRENDPSASTSVAHDHINDNHSAIPPSSFKGKWSNLFADNRKPIEDYMLKKVDFQASDGCLDFSDEALAADFMFDAPLCLIGYFFGIFPGVMALRRLYDSWSPGNLTHIQQIKYEKRPQFCSACWSIGHTALKCAKVNMNTSVARSSQFIWKPRNQKKQTSWQRVPVQSKQPHDSETEKMCPDPDPPSNLSTDLGSETPSASLNRAPGENALCTSVSSSSELASVQPGGEIPQPDPPCSQPQTDSLNIQPVELVIHGPDKEGFNKVHNRRRRKSTGLRTNPEHHQDKPRAKPSS